MQQKRFHRDVHIGRDHRPCQQRMGSSARPGTDDGFDRAAHLATRVMKGMTPANALDLAGGPYGGQSTRLGLTTLAVWHASDHYGQMVVYLRMNGVVPPGSQ